MGKRLRMAVPLVTVRLVRGTLPTRLMLQTYQLEWLTPLIRGLFNSYHPFFNSYLGVVQGNWNAVASTIELYKDLLLKYHVYSILSHRLHVLIWRNLIARLAKLKRGKQGSAVSLGWVTYKLKDRRQFIKHW